MVADEIRAEIEQLGVASVAPGQAALAETLARTFDETDAPTSRAVVARELSAVMKTLRALAPPEVKGDVVDELASRRPGRHSA